jgi:hypothetical protein
MRFNYRNLISKSSQSDFYVSSRPANALEKEVALKV